MAKLYNDLIQQTDEWYAARLGMFTGSDFHVMLGKSATKTNYMFEKLAETLFGDTDIEHFTTPAMERGRVLEHEARRMYSASKEVFVDEVGLVGAEGEFENYAACSPDGLVGDDGIIEIKCPLAKNFLEWVSNDFYIKPEYRTQVQFNLLITERQWCDFVYYHPRGGIFIKRIERDEGYIEKIKTALREGIQFIKDGINGCREIGFSGGDDNSQRSEG